jgi:hypothetical protein
MTTDTPAADNSAPRPRVVQRQLAVGEETIRVGAPQCGAPRIETHLGADGHVSAIDVHCRCGEVLRIICQYTKEPT